MEYIVAGCINCPLCKIDFGLNYYCGHPKFEEYSFIIELGDNEEPITPDGCPLNQYPLMLKKRDWQVFANFWNIKN